MLASVEASTLTISVLVWHSHEFVDRGVYLESAPNQGRILTADERDEIAGMATADDGLFASVEAQLSGLGAAPDA